MQPRPILPLNILPGSSGPPAILPLNTVGLPGAPSFPTTITTLPNPHSISSIPSSSSATASTLFPPRSSTGTSLLPTTATLPGLLPLTNLLPNVPRLPSLPPFLPPPSATPLGGGSVGGPSSLLPVSNTLLNNTNNNFLLRGGPLGTISGTLPPTRLPLSITGNTPSTVPTILPLSIINNNSGGTPSSSSSSSSSSLLPSTSTALPSLPLPFPSSSTGTNIGGGITALASSSSSNLHTGTLGINSNATTGSTTFSSLPSINNPSTQSGIIASSSTNSNDISSDITATTTVGASDRRRTIVPSSLILPLPYNIHNPSTVHLAGLHAFNPNGTLSSQIPNINLLNGGSFHLISNTTTPSVTALSITGNGVPLHSTASTSSSGLSSSSYPSGTGSSMYHHAGTNKNTNSRAEVGSQVTYLPVHNKTNVSSNNNNNNNNQDDGGTIKGLSLREDGILMYEVPRSVVPNLSSSFNSSSSSSSSNNNNNSDGGSSSSDTVKLLGSLGAFGELVPLPASTGSLPYQSTTTAVIEKIVTDITPDKKDKNYILSQTTGIQSLLRSVGTVDPIPLDQAYFVPPDGYPIMIGSMDSTTTTTNNTSTNSTSSNPPIDYFIEPSVRYGCQFIYNKVDNTFARIIPSSSPSPSANSAPSTAFNTITPENVLTLKVWLARHWTEPYPSTIELEKLIQQTQCSKNLLNLWFHYERINYGIGKSTKLLQLPTCNIHGTTLPLLTRSYRNAVQQLQNSLQITEITEKALMNDMINNENNVTSGNNNGNSTIGNSSGSYSSVRIGRDIRLHQSRGSTEKGTINKILNDVDTVSIDDHGYVRAYRRDGSSFIVHDTHLLDAILSLDSLNDIITDTSTMATGGKSSSSSKTDTIISKGTSAANNNTSSLLHNLNDISISRKRTRSIDEDTNTNDAKVTRRKMDSNANTTMTMTTGGTVPTSTSSSEFDNQHETIVPSVPDNTNTVSTTSSSNETDGYPVLPDGIQWMLSNDVPEKVSYVLIPIKQNSSSTSSASSSSSSSVTTSATSIMNGTGTKEVFILAEIIRPPVNDSSNTSSSLSLDNTYGSDYIVPLELLHSLPLEKETLHTFLQEKLSSIQENNYHYVGKLRKDSNNNMNNRVTVKMDKTHINSITISGNNSTVNDVFTVHSLLRSFRFEKDDSSSNNRYLSYHNKGKITNTSSNVNNSTHITSSTINNSTIKDQPKGASYPLSSVPDVTSAMLLSSSDDAPNNGLLETATTLLTVAGNNNSSSSINPSLPLPTDDYTATYLNNETTTTTTATVLSSSSSSSSASILMDQEHSPPLTALTHTLGSSLTTSSSPPLLLSSHHSQLPSFNDDVTVTAPGHIMDDSSSSASASSVPSMSPNSNPPNKNTNDNNNMEIENYFG